MDKNDLGTGKKDSNRRAAPGQTDASATAAASDKSTHPRRQPDFDIDVEDPRSYRERQEAYVSETELEDDPGTFEN